MEKLPQLLSCLNLRYILAQNPSLILQVLRHLAWLVPVVPIKQRPGSYRGQQNCQNDPEYFSPLRKEIGSQNQEYRKAPDRKDVNPIPWVQRRFRKTRLVVQRWHRTAHVEKHLCRRKNRQDSESGGRDSNTCHLIKKPSSFVSFATGWYGSTPASQYTTWRTAGYGQ